MNVHPQLKIVEERVLEFIREKFPEAMSINITGCLAPEFASMYWFLTPGLKDQPKVWMVTGEVRGKDGRVMRFILLIDEPTRFIKSYAFSPG